MLETGYRNCQANPHTKIGNADRVFTEAITQLKVVGSTGGMVWTKSLQRRFGHLGMNLQQILATRPALIVMHNDGNNRGRNFSLKLTDNDKKTNSF